MFSISGLAVATAALLAAGANAHGVATALIHWPDGTFYPGYDPGYQFVHPPPVVIGWSIPDDLNNSYISPSAYDTPDIVCHLGATPAGLAAPVNAGDVLEIVWNQWPESHHGPVLDYLANCNGPCETTDKTKLKFFKIGEAGLLDPAKNYWADDVLRANNLTWSVRLPADIAPGNYVLRHEIIALHSAGVPNGAQNYPFCFNLVVHGNGTATPAGIPATSLYTANGPGIMFNLYNGSTDYVIPGPPLYSSAMTAAQTKLGFVKATASGVSSYEPSAAGAAARAVPTPSVAPAATGAAATAAPVAAADQPAEPVPTTLLTAVLKAEGKE
ncbi:hypothetical protein HMPREF1624_08065 [Sporothrix schenckii ATCC 58251]|uniref:lytic cellulose monooxygenase (C4-dehydrogenating) n=1 Tax=Sporothrix schenckii (strain ATCC 58251 / de Perez 2211183) TaxID=1391915 RepID=U7PLE5_SPOS1|nr:hypothetical protein HMPREF1624_08065 [Sporothrix schenckii ATCC 58251]